MVSVILLRIKYTHLSILGVYIECELNYEHALCISHFDYRFTRIIL